MILAHNVRTESDNPWASSRDAVVLYAQNYKSLLKNAIFVTVIVWVLTLLIFVLVFAPVAALVSYFPGVAGFWTFVLAAVTAWGLKAAFVDPFAMTALMQVYFKKTRDQVPDPESSAKLEKMSDKFCILKDKGLATTPRPAATAVQPEPLAITVGTGDVENAD